MIISFLRNGKKNAQSVRFLSSMLKMEEVTLRVKIRHLIMDHKICIGSNTGKYPGYYLITEEDEIDCVYQSLRRRGIRILMRAAKLRRISLEEVFHQGILSLRGTE